MHPHVLHFTEVMILHSILWVLINALLKSCWCFYGEGVRYYYHLYPIRFRVFRVNLQFAINDHHNDVFYCRMAASLLSSYLDVKVPVAALAWRGEDVVAGGVQLENIPIKGLEVEIAPRTANLAIVDGTHTFKDRAGRGTTAAVIFSLHLHEWMFKHCLHT